MEQIFYEIPWTWLQLLQNSYKEACSFTKDGHLPTYFSRLLTTYARNVLKTLTNIYNKAFFVKRPFQSFIIFPKKLHHMFSGVSIMPLDQVDLISDLVRVCPMIYSKPEEQNDFGEFQKKFHSFIFRVPLKNKQELVVMDLILWPSSVKSNFRVWQRLKSVSFWKNILKRKIAAHLYLQNNS